MNASKKAKVNASLVNLQNEFTKKSFDEFCDKNKITFNPEDEKMQTLWL